MRTELREESVVPNFASLICWTLFKPRKFANRIINLGKSVTNNKISNGFKIFHEWWIQMYTRWGSGERGIWIYFQLGITHLNSFVARMTIQFLERVAFTSLPPRKKRRSEMDQAEGYTGNTPSDSNYWYLYVPVNCRPGIIYDEESVANTKICFTVATRRQYAEKLWVSRRVQLSKERYYFQLKSNVKNGTQRWLPKRR